MDVVSLGLDWELDTPIELVYESILLHRGRSDPDNAILSQLLTVGCTLQAFIALNESQWDALEIPVMLRIYIQAIAQHASQSMPLSKPSTTDNHPTLLNNMQKLECEFNMGLALSPDLHQQELIQQCTMLGFNEQDVIEAILVTAGVSLDRAVDFLLKSEPEKVAIRADAVEKQRRSVPYSQHYTLQALQAKVEYKAGNSPVKAASRRGRVAASQEELLRQELVRLQEQIKQEQMQRKKLEKALEQKVKVVDLQTYAEYLRGVLADGQVESTALDCLETYRKDKGISELQHVEVLKQLNLSPEQLSALVPSETKVMSIEMECIVCYERPKDHVVLDCMHICLCEVCVEEVMGNPNPKCPLCSSPIREIRKTFI